MNGLRAVNLYLDPPKYVKELAFGQLLGIWTSFSLAVEVQVELWGLGFAGVPDIQGLRFKVVRLRF